MSSQFPSSSDIKDSKFVRKEDVTESGNVCTIRAFERVNVAMDDQAPEHKWTMKVDGSDVQGNPLKPLVLNNTNWSLCERAFGPDSRNWVGKRIKLYHDPNVSFSGKLVGGVRIKTPPKDAAAAAPQPAAPTRDDFSSAGIPDHVNADDFNDPIPF